MYCDGHNNIGFGSENTNSIHITFGFTTDLKY